MTKHLEGSKRKGLIIAACITGAVVLAAVVAFIILGVNAQKTTAIFPGVSLSGVKVGGMTRDEAVSLLSEDENSSLFYGSVSVSLSESVTLVVSGSNAGLASSPEDAADLAMAYGRGGGFFGDAISYLKSAVSGTDISVSGMETFDEAAVRSLIATAAKSANEAAAGSVYTVENNELKIKKGANVTVDEDAVYDLVYGAFSEKNYDLIQYVPDESDAGSVDFDAIYNEIYKEPVSAYYDKKTNSIVRETDGISFDKEKAQELYDEAGYGETVLIPLVVTQPKDTYESLSALLFRDVLAEKSTTMYTSSDNRINNITLAAAAINGTVLMPGDEFSFNGTVGERTTAKGYKAAAAYVSGQSVDQIGGGICQVSSTIYYCTLMADLKVTARENHMFSVAYLPLGMDATVNWGTIDFKFKNDKDYPIKISASVSNKVLYIKLYGTKTDENYVKLQYELLSTIPFDTVEKVDSTLSPGAKKVESSGHNGYVVNVYKYIYDGNNNLLNTVFVSKDTYRKSDKVILVGQETGSSAETETKTGEASGTGTSTTGTATDSGGAGSETTATGTTIAEQ